MRFNLDGELVFTLMLVVLGMLAGATLHRRYMAWRRTRALRHGVRAEGRAERLLNKRGFKVIARQPERTWYPLVDGKSTPITVRGDFLVRKKRREFLVEVKTGASASLQVAVTRRQLLEYACVFEVDGLFLLDADRDTLVRVDFGI